MKLRKTSAEAPSEQLMEEVRERDKSGTATSSHGYRWVVDLDLEKVFDRVNHHKLMARISKRVSDKCMLRLIRAFLEAGVMDGGLVSLHDMRILQHLRSQPASK